MSQYHFVFNLDKHEFINPHELGDGLTLREFGMWSGGTMTALAVLLAVSDGRGNGDFDLEDPLVGSWGGDRIAIVGDMALPGDLPPEDMAGDIYHGCREGGWHDLSSDMRRLVELIGRHRFVREDGRAWRRVEVESPQART